MTMTTSTVDQARYRLEKAQEELRAAEVTQATLDTFPIVGEVHAVMARVPKFDQFVSYSTEGILVAVCSSEEEAARYVRDVKPPVGYSLVSEPIALLA